MRSVIVDFARRRQALRRGGGRGKVTLTTGIVDVASGETEILRRAGRPRGLVAAAPSFRTRHVISELLQRFLGRYSGDWQAR